VNIPRPLRVLSLATLYPNDNAPNFGVFVERQMEAVAATGAVDLTVVNPIGLPPFPLCLHPRYRKLAALGDEVRCGVPVLRPRFTLIPTISGRFNARAIARAVLPLARRLHADQPFDIVDAQFFYPDGPAAARIAAALNLPCSIKARGADIHHWGKTPGTARQVREAGRAATGLLAVSSGLADDMAELGMPHANITIHRTGLDRAVYRPLDRYEARAALGLPADVPVLATVGALIPRKGQSLVIAALPALPGAILLLAGTGPDEATLREQARALGVAERVRFMGPVPHRELPVVLSAADVFVLPSASEGLANAWVEALACGTPVVTTPIPGARELITNRDYGRLAERNAPAIAAALREILANAPTREAVTRGADGFSWEASAAALIAHWRRLANR